MPARPASPCSTCRAACACWSAAAPTSTASSIAPLKAKRQPGSAFKTFVYLAALEERHAARQHRAGSADPRRRLEPAQRRRTVSRHRHAARCARPVDERGRGAPQHDGRAAQDGSGRAPPRHPLRAARGSLARARHVGGDAARADQRLRRARQRRPRGRAAHHQPRAHRLRPA